MQPYRQMKSVEVVADAVKFVLDMINALSCSTYRGVDGKSTKGSLCLSVVSGP